MSLKQKYLVRIWRENLGKQDGEREQQDRRPWKGQSPPWWPLLLACSEGAGPRPLPGGPSEPVQRMRGAARSPCLSFPTWEMSINGPILLQGGNHSPGLQPDVCVLSPTALPPSRAPGQRARRGDRRARQIRRSSPGAVGVKFSSAWFPCPQLSAWPLRAL